MQTVVQKICESAGFNSVWLIIDCAPILPASVSYTWIIQKSVQIRVSCENPQGSLFQTSLNWAEFSWADKPTKICFCQLLFPSMWPLSLDGARHRYKTALAALRASISAVPFVLQNHPQAQTQIYVIPQFIKRGHFGSSCGFDPNFIWRGS